VIERNSLIQGECVKGMAQLDDASVDLVFADPPFNIGYKYDLYEDRKEADDYLTWTRQWVEQVKRVLKPNGTFWLAIGDDFAAELKVLVQRDLGFCCRSWVIWYYTFGVNCTKKFSRSHTHLLHFVKDPKNFTFNAAQIRVPSARQTVYADSRADSKGRLPDDTWVLRPQDLEDGFKPDENVWYFPRVCGTFKERAGFHGCQMPEQLLARIIRVSSNPGELVLDPFAGSGSTLIVAKKLGRDWLGFEISTNYAKRTRERLKEALPGDLPEGPEDPLTSAPKTAAGRRLARKEVELILPPSVVSKSELDAAVLEAFVITREHYPVDRVIADPELNAKFTDRCSRWGLPGTAFEWNQRLMNLRKAGRLSDLPRSKRTSFTDEERDCCVFACEIVIQQFHERGVSLDQVLCDPKTAAEFDESVRSIVGRDLSSLLMRWVAFGIRKRAEAARRKAAAIVQSKKRLPAHRIIAIDLDVAAIPATSGLYWLENAQAQRNLYVGGTLNLQKRLEAQVLTSTFDFWGTAKHQLAVRIQKEDATKLSGFQSYWIRHWKPEGNYCKLAVQ
jgi:site-specific DNA-methyltransferase (adenine-specific)